MTTTAARARSRPTTRLPTLGAGAAVLFAAIGAGIGLRPISDNSLFTHIATGRLILAAGVPHNDPYSWSAPGSPWVVQSWLPSLLFGVLDKVADGNGIRVLAAVLTGGLTLLAWRLTRPATTLLPRVGITGLVVVVGGTFWVPRPLLVGLLCTAVVLLVLEEERDPRWLLPLFWVWTNSHGSFPLGLALIGTVALGLRLDHERAEPAVKALVWAIGGTILGVVSPVGPALLGFPVTLLGKMEILQTVVEWQSPPFSQWWARVFLVQVVVAVVALVRRPSYRAAVPLVVFVAASLLGLRNVPVASIVLVPGMAAGLAGLGRVPAKARTPAGAILVAAGVLLAVLQLAVQLGQPAYDLSTYPVTALSWLDQRGLLGGDTRLLTQDTVGNLLELTHGTDVPVFVDDRYDMYPLPVLRDYLTLHRGSPGWADVLDRDRVDVVLWDRGGPLPQLLAADDRWVVAYQDGNAVVACRRGSAAAARCTAP